MDSYQNKIDENRRILGISNTYLKGLPPLSHAKDAIRELLADREPLLVIPYALQDMDRYADVLREAFLWVGISRVESIHTSPGDEVARLEKAGAVFIGGGNTPRLLANLHALRQPDGRLLDPRPGAAQSSLVDALRRRVGEGMPILGASAGTNVLCADIRTTNDMHIAVQQLPGGPLVSRLDGLGLLPANLSINPHYLDKNDLSEAERDSLSGELKLKILTIIDHQGESRTERLRRVLEMDPGRTILALREGAYIKVEGMQMKLGGTTGGLIFRSDEEPRALEPGVDLSFLLAGAG